MTSSWCRALLMPALVACGGGGGFPPDAGIDGPAPAGKFSLAWTVSDTGGAAIPCSRVGAQVIAIGLRNHAVQGGTNEAFTCSTLQGTSGLLEPGTYDATFQLTGLAGRQLAVAPPQLAFEIRANETTELAPLAFAVDATGGIDLRLDANQTGGNCEAVAQNGAGITTNTITLEHAAGLACEPVTFQVSAGATGQAGTYTVDCTTPATIACLERDQRLTVSTMPSDTYRIHVRGQIGLTSCWTNDDSLVVPPLGGTLTTTLNLAKQMTPGC